FADRLAQQARRFGVEMLQAQEVTGLRAEDESRYITTGDGAEYGARAVLIATGSTYRRLGVPGEGDLIGAGIHFCATCDGPFYKGSRQLLVIGGGNSAVEEGLFLTQFTERVTLIDHGPALRASALLQEKARAHPKFEIYTNTEVTAFKGQDHLEAVTVRDLGNGQTRDLMPQGAFVFIGLTPNTGFLQGAVELD